MSFGPGAWHLTCVKHERHAESGAPIAAIDLSAGDQQTVMGYRSDGPSKTNQVWEFEPAENGNYYIKNRQYGKYLTFPDEPENGKPIIATGPENGRREWEVRVGHAGKNVKDERESIRIFVPGTDKNLDLTDHGNPEDGTLMQLWSETAGENQQFYFVPGRCRYPVNAIAN